MRRLAILTVLTAGYFAAAAPREANASRSRVAGAGISIGVPHGWRVVHGWLSDVTDPIPRLAIASFPVSLSRHACECGEPNVLNLPRAGAFVFMWEYPHLSAAQLRRIPRRPASFRVGQGNPHWFVCAGPSWGTSFRDWGRAFQVEVYLGPAAGTGVQARVDALLASIHVTPPGS